MNEVNTSIPVEGASLICYNCLTMFMTVGKWLIILGVIFIIIGILIVSGRFPNPGLGRLPGDILIKKANFSFYFPLTSCILISVVMMILLRIFQKR